jgi:hypothetical protein
MRVCEPTLGVVVGATFPYSGGVAQLQGVLHLVRPGSSQWHGVKSGWTLTGFMLRPDRLNKLPVSSFLSLSSF